jgi:hypothetical protein
MTFKISVFRIGDEIVKVRDNWKNDYELLVSGNDGIDHLADAVALEESVLVAWRLVLQVLHYQPLQPLHLLVRRARHLKQRRRHPLLLFQSTCT